MNLIRIIRTRSTTARALRRAAIAIVGTLSLQSAAPPARADGNEIVRLDQTATPTEHGRYPGDMVVRFGTSAFDGSYTQAVAFRSKDRELTVGTWQSEPGVLDNATQSGGYPYDEYCLVLEGNLIVTNRNGRSDSFGPGDSFVIPKGWVGTWKMTTRFKKRYVAFDAAPRQGER